VCPHRGSYYKRQVLVNEVVVNVSISGVAEGELLYLIGTAAPQQLAEPLKQAVLLAQQRILYQTKTIG
jgi:hypothetical protein